MDRHARNPAIVRFAWMALLVLIAHLAVSAIDREMADWMRTAPDCLLGTFRALTELGDSKWYLVPSALVAITGLVAGRFLLKGRRARAVSSWLGGAAAFVFASVAVSGILVNAIKILVGRARPKLLDLENFLSLSPLSLQGDFHSFPSGHSNTAFAVALAMGFLMPRIRLPLLVLAALVASSRVVVTAHFVTDIIGGAAVAIITAYWIRNLSADRGWVLARRGDGMVLPRWPARLLPALAVVALRRALSQVVPRRDKLARPREAPREVGGRAE